jgi:hypothetical protein
LSRNARVIVAVDRNEPKSGRQPHVSEYLERPTFVNEQSLGNTEQHADDAVLTTRAPNRAVVAVDSDRAHVGPLVVVSHSAVLLLGVARTVSPGTDI